MCSFGRSDALNKKQSWACRSKNGRFVEIANSSGRMKIRADDLKDMAEEMNTTVGSYKV